MINIIDKIQKLKKEKKAIILSHYYINGEVQDIADYVGDSYQLSVIAKNTDAEIIIFCGVRFMAETAKILSPEKKVILPVRSAGCYMVDTLIYEELINYKITHPNVKIVSYVNTSAKVKAISDVCVTSSNAIKILNHYKDEEVIYIPDQNLAKYVNYLNGNDHIKYWDGCCFIHHNLKPELVDRAKEEHPQAKVLVHPEAPLNVLQKADFVGSTKAIIDYATNSNAKDFIIGTEKGILHKLKQQNPHKNFYILTPALTCRTMKLTTIEDVYNAISENSDGRYEEIKLDKDIIKQAQQALNKMIEWS